MPSPTTGLCRDNAKAYIALLNANKWAFGLVTYMRTIDTDLVAIEHRGGLPPELLEKLRGLAVQFGESIGARVVLYPKTFDVESIKGVPRDQVIPYLRDLCRAVGCELVVPEEVEPIVFPNLPPEKMEEVRQAVKNSEPGNIICCRSL